MKQNNVKYQLGTIECRSVLNKYKTGEAGEETNWYIMPRVETFDTVEAALKEVTENKLGFKWRKKAWSFFDGRFIGDFMVDAENTEVTDPAVIQKWKKGKRKLWSCTVDVQMDEVRKREVKKATAKAEGFEAI